MRGDIWCVCWTCKKSYFLNEETITDWLKDHWGHDVLLREEVEDGEYDVRVLPFLEVKE